MTNRLSGAASDYLRQHAANPIDWWQWGPDAFAEAERRDVPLFISVGYSACHWCHVMAHETFEDEDVAAYLNEHFVAIKVDREERPDVDAVYMRATQAITGQGGWPMTVFATPNGHPFFAGTYYPPEPRGGMPSFRQVAQALGEAWSSRRDEMLAGADLIVERLAEVNELPHIDLAPDVWELLDDVSSDFDVVHGGFGSAPKFPAPLLVDALLVKGEPGTLDVAQRTLEAMARGGVHDQVGGGFHRYAVDAGWVVPHFEKMLYDNAHLLGAYTRGWRRTPSDMARLRWLFERVIRGVVGWLLREMTVPSGGFAASLDADSADIRGMAHEGIFYAWNPELLTDALGEEDATWAADVFHVTNNGTFEHGLSTLQLRGAPDPERLERVVGRLLEVRQGRFAPPRDDKVVTAWNGWAIDSLLWAAMVFGEREWLDAATAAAEAVWVSNVVDGQVRRSSMNGEPGDVVGFADDHGALALAYGRLAGVLGDPSWLERAVDILDAALVLFGAEDGGFHDAPSGDLFTRPRDVADSPSPSGTMSLVAALRHVGLLADRPDFVRRADAAARTTWGTLEAHPRQAPAALADALGEDEARKGLRPGVAVILDADADPLNDAARACWRMAPFGTVIVSGRPGTTGFAHHFDDRDTVPIPTAAIGPGGLVQGVGDQGVGDSEYDEHEVVSTGQVVFVCRGETCFAPASSVQEIRAALWSRA